MSTEVKKTRRPRRTQREIRAERAARLRAELEAAERLADEAEKAAYDKAQERLGKVVIDALGVDDSYDLEKRLSVVTDKRVKAALAGLDKAFNEALDEAEEEDTKAEAQPAEAAESKVAGEPAKPAQTAQPAVQRSAPPVTGGNPFQAGPQPQR